MKSYLWFKSLHNDLLLFGYILLIIELLSRFVQLLNLWVLTHGGPQLNTRALKLTDLLVQAIHLYLVSFNLPIHHEHILLLAG